MNGQGELIVMIIIMVVIKIDNNDKDQCKFYELSVKKKDRIFYLCIVTWCPGGLREGRYLGELRSWWITCEREGAG